MSRNIFRASHIVAAAVAAVAHLHNREHFGLLAFALSVANTQRIGDDDCCRVCRRRRDCIVGFLL